MKPNVSVQAILDEQDAQYNRGFWDGHDHPTAPLPQWYSTTTLNRLTAYERGYYLGREVSLIEGKGPDVPT